MTSTLLKRALGATFNSLSKKGLAFAFEPDPPTIGANRVWVPQHLFKLVYDPSTGRVWAHWLDNRDDARVGKPISYADLVRRTGIEFLPASSSTASLAASISYGFSPR